MCLLNFLGNVLQHVSNRDLIHCQLIFFELGSFGILYELIYWFICV